MQRNVRPWNECFIALYTKACVAAYERLEQTRCSTCTLSKQSSTLLEQVERVEDCKLRVSASED